MTSDVPSGPNDSKRSIAVVGAGGHGRSVADCAEACGWASVQLFDADTRPSGPFEVSGTIEDLMGRLDDFDGVVVAEADGKARLHRQRALEAAGARLITLVHPRATASRHARVGPGSVLMAGSVVGVGCRLGAATVINTGATVDHDCLLGDGVHVAPGAHVAGGVRVGDESWIGLGALVRESVTIGNRVFIGAGAVVVKSIPDGLTVVGAPARPLQR